jgi:hypothetical protein
MPYIGSDPSNRFVAPKATTRLSGNGSTTAFTLEHAVGSDEDILVSVDGVIQEPSIAYAVSSGTTLTFTAAPSSGTNNIFVCYLFRTVGTVSHPSNNALTATNGTLTGTLDVTGNSTVGGTLGVTGASTLTGALSAKGGVVFNEDSADVDFRVESNGNANMLVVDGGNDNVGISNSAPPSTLTIGDGTLNLSPFDLAAANSGQDAIFINSNSQSTSTGTKGNSIGFGANDGHTNRHAAICTVQTASDRDQVGLAFHVHDDASQTADLIEAARIENNGNILFGVTSNPVSQSGTGAGGQFFGRNTYTAFAKVGGVVSYFNRQYSDGNVIAIRQDGSDVGFISVSGTTTSYGAFSGSHWSRLTDNSKPTILRGTVVETIDEMCDWYQAKFTIPKTDDNDERIIKDSIALPEGKKVGDTISHTYEDVTYDDAVIIKEEDNKHTKCKISDTADSKRVYGVFADWDNDDDTVNDMYVTACGTHVVRINKDVTVQAGDLLSSNGDGTAKVQDDDIIRSKTIGKVLTNIKQETYDDGSYTVPCALYCG